MKRQLSETGVRLAKHKIFNKLCSSHRHSNPNAVALRADDLRKELAIREDIFAEALDSFVHAENQMAVEIFQYKGERYVRLAPPARDNCADW